jgi:hypothetical protein
MRRKLGKIFQSVTATMLARSALLVARPAADH